MTTDRRTFLQLSVAAGGAIVLGGLPAAIRAQPAAGGAPRTLRILILGGTGLTGPHQVRYALERGHHVTVFNRGRRNDILPREVVQLQGDRNAHEVDALKGQDWDVVIDNPTTLPFWVRDAAEVLEGHVGQYVFISTISVYDAAGQTRISEDSPLARYTGADPLAETMESFRANVGELYGPLKVEAEREAQKWYGERTTIIRPGLIVGPGDATFRFTYWPWRVSQRGGDVLAPGDGSDPVQVIDARDLAEWTIRMVESGHTGVYNATGPAGVLTMQDMLGGVRGAFDGNRPVNFVWVPWEFLEAHEVQPWAEMTTWIPASDPSQVISKTDNTRAIAKSLTFRPLAATSVEAVAWVLAQPADERERLTRTAGLDAAKERKILAAWQEHG